MSLPSLRELHNEYLEERTATEKTTLLNRIIKPAAETEQTRHSYPSVQEKSSLTHYAGSTVSNGEGLAESNAATHTVSSCPGTNAINCPGAIGSKCQELSATHLIGKNCLNHAITADLNAAGPPVPLPAEFSGNQIASGEPAEQKTDNSAAKKKYGLTSFMADALFYIAIAVIMVSVMTSGGNSGSPKTILGYSYFTVLTSSMQNEIPKNSFILVKQIHPNELVVGDNITYMRDYTTSVTHKIIEIIENYDGSKKRGFRTQGTNNANPDKEIVPAANVVGKVVYSVPNVGAFIIYLETNLHLVYIIFGLCMIFSFSIRGLLVKQKREAKPG